MLKTSILMQEESIFDELLSRFDALSEEQMQAVGVTREWSAEDLLGHLAHWAQGAEGQVCNRMPYGDRECGSLEGTGERS